MTGDDLGYYTRRAADEAALALRATDAKAAAAHRRLATAYRERVTSLGSGGPEAAAPE